MSYTQLLLLYSKWARSANGRDLIPTTAGIWPTLHFNIIAEDKPTVGQLLTVLATAGLDTVQMTPTCAACRQWVFRALKALAHARLIRDDWERRALQWNDDVIRVAGEQGVRVMEEDILTL